MTPTPSASPDPCHAHDERMALQHGTGISHPAPPETASADAGEGTPLREVMNWLALEALNLERSGARTYEGGGVDAALANSGARMDRQRAAQYRTILAALRQTSSEPVALSASDRACYEYPGLDQAKERDAFVAGAEAYAAPEHAASERVRVLEEIAAERQRQVQQEGWTVEHDDEHCYGEMAKAAACYAAGRIVSAIPQEMHPDRGAAGYRSLWPWDMKWWKPKTYRRNLLRAAALIVAEIERLDRATLNPQSQEKGV